MINASAIVREDSATPFLAKAISTLEQKLPIHQAMAEGATALVQRHFVGLSVTNRNPFGAPASFWQRMVGGTKALATQSAGYVVAPAPIRLRYFGGTVKPVRTKFLSIPARKEAYNKSPRDFNDLRFVPTRKGGMLVEKDQTTIDGRTRLGGLVFYWLVKSATIRGNSEVLPSDEQMATAALEAGEGFIRRRLGI